MRWTIVTSAALLGLWLSYAASPFVALYRFVDAVQTGDVAGLSERVDFPALRGSLAVQIATAYLRMTGKSPGTGSLLEQFAAGVAASVADPIVAKLISPEALLHLLQNGNPTGVFTDKVPPTEGLGTDALGNFWRAYANSELGIARFFISVPVDKPRAESFLLQFCLTGWMWKLCAAQLPEQLQIRLAQEVMKSQQQ